MTTGTQADVLLAVEDIHLSFAGVTALDGVSLDVRERELFAVIGPNVAGKTSLFNCLNGLYRPQRGSIRFAGHDLVGERPDEIARLGLARTFQNVELFDQLTVLENLLLGRQQRFTYSALAAVFYFGRPRREETLHRLAVEEIVDFLEIERYRKMPVGLLPYGIKKRVELGRALAMEPRLLLLDEPVAGMNLEETEDMARFILDIQAEFHIAMILVEHDMGLVMDIADRVAVLDFGCLLALGTPPEVQKDPTVLRAYLGEELEQPGATP
jgi:branched-chain amino acid transport system ATP-binding protein